MDDRWQGMTPAQAWQIHYLEQQLAAQNYQNHLQEKRIKDSRYNTALLLWLFLGIPAIIGGGLLLLYIISGVSRGF